MLIINEKWSPRPHHAFLSPVLSPSHLAVGQKQKAPPFPSPADLSDPQPNQTPQHFLQRPVQETWINPTLIQSHIRRDLP
jgi:hypothetical protein